MKDYLNELKSNKKSLISAIFSVVVFLGLVIGAAYAYFNVDQINNTAPSNLQASSRDIGTVTLNDGDDLRLDLTSDDMSYQDAEVTYWGTVDGSPSLIESSATIASASVNGEGMMSCTYTMTISQTSTGADKDLLTSFRNWTDAGKGSNQIVLTINDGNNIQTYDFNNSELSFPYTYNGKMTGLTASRARKLKASFKIVNLKDVDQSYMAGTDITFNFEFSNLKCELTGEAREELATKLINDEVMWTSTLEGDGYRFTGSGSATDETSPNNFICFGTTNKDECIANPSKYLYRIIGVFPDSEGDNYTKLIKYTQTAAHAWNSVNTVNISWSESSLYNDLNGSYFLTNTNYEYMQDDDWLNKIADWTWTAANTQTNNNSGPSYYSLTSEQLYLHEMNRASKTVSIGEWTTPTAKIGIMYASDYALSLGASALTLNGSNRETLITGWMHQSNNDITVYNLEWTMVKYGGTSTILAWYVSSTGTISNNSVSYARAVRPVFYLKTETGYKSGTGSIEDPFIIS